MLGSPPTAPGSLEEKLQVISRDLFGRGGLFEEICVVDKGQIVHVLQAGRALGRVHQQLRSREYPGWQSYERPSSTARTKSGRTTSASPETTASTNGNRRMTSLPMTPSQLAPPNKITMSGYRSFRRFASASEASCCWNTLVNPTIRGRLAASRSAYSSRNGVAAARACRTASTELVGSWGLRLLVHAAG